MSKTNISEQVLYERYPRVLDTLLFDRTTRQNILWATDDYDHVSEAHRARASITAETITGKFADIISPRTAKTLDKQTYRTKDKAEVFTPSWLCNEQNNLVDEAWFGRSEVFNTPVRNGWRTHRNKIQFPAKSSRSWKRYVDEKRLEITCGEAPYLVSRYDATTGCPIPLRRRIGLLDRKLRVVAENTSTEQEWLNWSERAFQSVYGFEYQGDSLLLARENLLASYRDYMQSALRRSPSEKEYARIALIISWNVWQMDGLTGTIPFRKGASPNQMAPLFTDLDKNIGKPCVIHDWRAKKTIPFISLTIGGISQ